MVPCHSCLIVGYLLSTCTYSLGTPTCIYLLVGTGAEHSHMLALLVYTYINMCAILQLTCMDYTVYTCTHVLYSIIMNHL